MDQILESLKKLADRLRSEVTRARDNAQVERIIDLHAECVKFINQIEEGIEISLDAVEDFLRRADVA